MIHLRNQLLISTSISSINIRFILQVLIAYLITQVMRLRFVEFGMHCYKMSFKHRFITEASTLYG